MPDLYSVTIVVPMVPPSVNELRRKYRNPHVYADLRNAWQRTIFALVGYSDRNWLVANASNLTKMKATICIETTSGRLRDPDNLVGSMKPVLDSLVRNHFLADDNNERLQLCVEQQKSPNRCTRIKLEVAP